MMDKGNFRVSGCDVPGSSSKKPLARVRTATAHAAQTARQNYGDGRACRSEGSRNKSTRSGHPLLRDRSRDNPLRRRDTCVAGPQHRVYVRRNAKT